MSNMTKQPSYRFVGYTEPWEEKKLGDFSDVTKLAGFEFTNHVKYSSAGSIIALRGLNIKNGNIILNDVKYIDESDFSKLHRSKLIINDIMFTYVGTVGELAIIEDNNKFYLAPNVSRIRILNDTYPYFLMQYMWRKSFYQSVIFPLIATSSQPALSMENIRKFNISLPSLPEQTAIGSFFQDIDQLISLQQRKLEVLKEQKKTYLKLLFPAKGQTKPALRFAGFEDEWKEVKVSDIFRVTRGQVLATTEISEEKTDTHKYPVYSSQTKNEGLLGYYDKYLFETAITWTTDGANAGTVNYREGKFYSTNVNGVLLSDEGFANKVIAEILNNEAWKYVSKVGNPKLMNNVMSEISLVIPNDFREISTLSTFFQDLDKAIAKQEEKVNQLKESKQTLLRKMFI